MYVYINIDSKVFRDLAATEPQNSPTCIALMCGAIANYVVHENQFQLIKNIDHTKVDDLSNNKPEKLYPYINTLLIESFSSEQWDVK